MTYWLQVESIKGLPRLENAETVSLYEVKRSRDGEANCVGFSGS